MKWADIRDDEIFVVQEKTNTKVWIPLHRDLKAHLDATPHVSDFILNSTLGRPFSSSQSLYEKFKTMLRRIGEGGYVPHGLRATAAVRLIEAGCSEDQAIAISTCCAAMCARQIKRSWPARRYGSKRRQDETGI